MIELGPCIYRTGYEYVLIGHPNQTWVESAMTTGSLHQGVWIMTSSIPAAFKKQQAQQPTQPTK